MFGIKGTSLFGGRAKARPKSFVSGPRVPFTTLYPLPPQTRALPLWTTQKRLTWGSADFLTPTAGDISGYEQSFYSQPWPLSRKVL